jgi:spermidine/putrescine-binding protein
MNKMRRFLVLLLCVCLCAPALSGCSKKDGEAGDGTSLYVYNWGEYIDEAVIDMFEEETGIKVTYSDFETNEELYTIIKAGAQIYDVICPSDYMIDKMIQGNMLYPINKDNIPELKNIAPEQMEAAAQFDPDNKYAVPYCWGTVGILYNKTKVTEPIDSWSVLFDSKYSKQILMMDSVRDAFMVALSYLGYSINTTNAEELDQARDLLKNQYPLVQSYVVDQARDKMIGNEAALAVIYSGEAIYTKSENDDLEYVVPTEGSNVWLDGWVIPANAKNKTNAEKWINFMCRPDIALMNFEEITYSTPNAAAREMIEDPDIKDSEVAFPSVEILRRCEVFKYLGDEVESMYTERWNEVK